MSAQLSHPDGFRALLPEVVAVEETDGDVSEATLFPEEHACVVNAVEQRRREFATVRYCARGALAQLGHPAVALVPGRQRAPEWPDGIVGSMTHCDGYRAAAVAWHTEMRAIGIDAELNEPLPEGVMDMVTIGDEPRALRTLAGSQPSIAWDHLLFSIKESIYKAWYPLTRSWLDFSQCEVSIGPGVFTGRLSVVRRTTDSVPLEQIRGSWGVYGRHLLTAALIPGMSRETPIAAARSSVVEQQPVNDTSELERPRVADTVAAIES